AQAVDPTGWPQARQQTQWPPARAPGRNTSPGWPGDTAPGWADNGSRRAADGRAAGGWVAGGYQRGYQPPGDRPGAGRAAPGAGKARRAAPEPADRGGWRAYLLVTTLFLLIAAGLGGAL